MTAPVKGPVKRYRKGADFERRVSHDLTGDGYHVSRSAGSKTVIDLTAFKSGEILFVQCKHDGRIGPAERRELLDLAALIAAVPLLAANTGPRGNRIEYFELTGPGPRDREPWSPDHALDAFADLTQMPPESL